MCHILKSHGDRGSSDPAQERWQCRAEQGQSAGGMGRAKQATVFTPERIALPVPALTAPVTLDLLGDHTVRNFFGVARNEVAGQVRFGFGASGTLWTVGRGCPPLPLF